MLKDRLVPPQVPSGTHKKELLEFLDKVPTFVQQLQFTVKNPTVGKAATFTKVCPLLHIFLRPRTWSKIYPITLRGRGFVPWHPKT